MFSSTNQEGHKCTIRTESTSFLPKLPPYAHFLKRWWRAWKKYLLVSELYLTTRFHFRSSAAIHSERKRQIRYYPSYIIHPFSKFAIVREVVLFFTWCLVFIVGPMGVTFHHRTGDNQKSVLVRSIVRSILIINIVLCFMCGYHNPRTKETILSPKKIAIRYIKTYFFFDVIGDVPVTALFSKEQTETLGMTLLIFIKHIFLYPRLITMFEYFRQITLFFNVGDSLHEIICTISLSLLALHWGTCFVYFGYDVYYLFKESDWSWIHKAGLGHNATTTGKKYTLCMYMVMTHFYRTGRGKYRIFSVGDCIAFSFINLAGTVFHAYIIVIILQAIGAASASENKYSELIYQMTNYLRTKKMPLYLNVRLRSYYEYRFQNRYFRESAILSTLSEHLRHEIHLHTCQHLITKVDMFRGLPKNLIGAIIGGFKLEIYMTNDVIVNCKAPEEYIYIISYGTVACYHKQGVEVIHLVDGEVFGVDTLVRKRTNFNIVAVEICEVFRMKQIEFKQFMKVPAIKRRIRTLVEARELETYHFLSRYDKEYKEKQEVLYKVRDHKIIETGHTRR